MKKINMPRETKRIPDPSSSLPRHPHSSFLNGFIPANNVSNSSSCSPPVLGNNNNNNNNNSVCKNNFNSGPESNRFYYWSSLSSSNTTTTATAETLARPIYDDSNNTLPPPPNFRLNFVKKMEDSLILRLPQGSCDTTPDTPDSLDDDSVDQSSLPPTPLPIPVSDLPLPNPPSQQQQTLMHSRHDFKSNNSPDPWFMRENLIEEVSAPPNAVCSSASSPATPIGSPLAQQRTMLRSISQVRLNNSNNNNHHPNSSIIHFNTHSSSNVPHPPPSNGKPPRTYSSLYPQMISTSSNVKTGARHDANNNKEVEDSNETRPFKSQTLLTTTTTTTTKVIESSTNNGDQVNSHTIKGRKKPPAPPSSASRYATIGTRVKRSTIINNNNRIINANLSSSTLHCTKTNRDPLPLKPPPYQDPPKYRKPRTTVSMENNPANSSSSCFTIDSAMNSINNTNNDPPPCDPPEVNPFQKDVVETQNAILKDLQRHMSYELLENPRHVTSEEEEEEENHVEADVRVTTSLLQIKSKSLPTIARMQQQNQLTNGHCYKLGSNEKVPEESCEDPIQERLRNDSLSTLNEVSSSKIANLSSASSSMINKLRTDTNRDHLEVQTKPIDLDRGGGGGHIKPGRSRVDSIVDRDIIEDKDEKKRKLHNGNLISKEPESSQISTTDDDFETTDEENHRSHHHHHRKYRRKRSSMSHPDSIEETEDDDVDDDLNGETESPEMEICDPCHCYGKCCLDVVASIFCVSLL